MRLVRCSRLLCSTAHLIIYPYDSVLRVPAQELQRHPPGKTCGLERPPRFPWQRSGVAPDHVGALLASKLRVAPCATSTLPTISPRPWVTLTVTGMVTCVFHAPVTFPGEKRALNLIRILPPLDRRGSRKQKMQKANRDRHRSVPGLPSFLIVVFGPLLESLTLLHPCSNFQTLPPETAYETVSPGLR